MPHEIGMGDDGIVRTAFIGDMTKEDMEAFEKDAMLFLEAATEEEPVHVLHDSSRLGKYSSAARKILLNLNSDPRVGKFASVGARQYSRVLASFILKATGRRNIRFFGSEEEALAWLKAKN